MQSFSYSSSLRAVPIEETLRRARDWGLRLGVTRVTDITRLDRIGIPVCVGIRPGAVSGSLCVHAGKGIRLEEAQVGAWMEAIEYALAEPGVSCVPTVVATARDVLDGRERPSAILDLCPLLGASIPLDAPMACVQAEELGGGTCLLPAELIFIPSPPPISSGGPWFGSHSGGLASGNTLLEATVQGLLEAIEHDINSFRILQNTTLPVRLESLPLPLWPSATVFVPPGWRYNYTISRTSSICPSSWRD